MKHRDDGKSRAGVRYRVGLEPDQVLERLGRLPDVQAYTKERMPDLGDVVPARRFVAQIDADEFRICLGGGASQPGSMRGFDQGGGMLRRLYLRGRIRRLEVGTEVALDFEQERTPRSLLRWLGFLATGGCALIWLFLGASGTFDERLVLVGVFLAFTVPVILHDLKQLFALRSQRLELYSLVEGLLGPEALTEAEDAPYRRHLSAG